MVRVTGELAKLATTAADEAQRLLTNANRALRRARVQADALCKRGIHDATAGRRRGRPARGVHDLQNLLAATRQIVAQTRQRIAGHTPRWGNATGQPARRRCPPDRQGTAGLGQKDQVVDNYDGIVLDHSVEQSNPPDAPQLAPAVARVKKRAGRTPGTVTADRGYGEAKVDQQLTDLGVQTVVIPRKGKPSQTRRAEEHRKAFRRTVKWRTGAEGRISCLKRGYGWDRTRIDGLEGTRIWTGHGILAHNLVKISALAAWQPTRSPAAVPGQHHRQRQCVSDPTPFTFSGRSS